MHEQKLFIKMKIKMIGKMGKIIKISDEEIKKIIDFYNNSVYGVEERATTNQEGRAYGGVIRAEKGRAIANKLKEAQEILESNN
jgi:hypothetical protein